MWEPWEFPEMEGNISHSPHIPRAREMGERPDKTQRSVGARLPQGQLDKFSSTILDSMYSRSSNPSHNVSTKDCSLTSKS
jgi:hypothetical protein